MDRPPETSEIEGCCLEATNWLVLANKTPDDGRRATLLELALYWIRRAERIDDGKLVGLRVELNGGPLVGGLTEPKSVVPC